MPYKSTRFRSARIRDRAKPGFFDVEEEALDEVCVHSCDLYNIRPQSECTGSMLSAAMCDLLGDSPLLAQCH